MNFSLSLKAKAAFSITAIVLFILALGGAVLYSVQKSEGDADVINAAGRQRMLSQAMAKSALSYTLVKNGLQAAESQVSELDRYITKMRGTYTASVIKPAKQANLTISMHPQDEYVPAVPFPATFTRLVGEKFAAGGNFKVTIISDDPVNPEQKLKDATDREAFSALKTNPDQIFFKPVESGGKLYLRYYTADKAVLEGCASCHTKIKGQDYKVGDMLGIRRYTQLFSDDIARGYSRLKPSLDEYKNASAIFAQTLATFVPGGKYPADLKMSQYKMNEGSDDPAIQTIVRSIESSLAKFTQTVELLTTSEIGSNPYWQAQQAMPVLANELRQASNELTQIITTNARSNQQNILLAVSIMVAAVLAAFIGLYLLLNRLVLNPVAQITSIANKIADGDLNQKIESGRNDEIGELTSALSKMALSLNQMITKIAGVSHSITSASDTINQATHRVELGAEKQSEQTQVVVVSTNQMKEVSQEISQNTTEAADAANQAALVAIEGGSVVQESIKGMTQISNSVLESVDTVEQLAQHSNQIGQIVSVIEDIASQTNLLALNAAIEAARAGEQGRGFAVVADEVRSLANRTTEATKEIAEMVGNIQSGTQTAVKTMHEGRVEVEAGSELVDKTGQSLQQIVEVVESLKVRIDQIATAAHEQSITMEEVNSNITTISCETETTKEQAHRSAESCSEINHLASDLQSMVGQFKL